MTQPTNRREFIAASSVLMATTAVGVSKVARGQDANSQIVVGLIGCGGRGVHDAGLFKNQPNVKLAYVCDVDQRRRGEAAEKLDVPTDHAVGDLRRVLDDKSIDAVIVATPDHWHSPAAILAANAGKHVYVEKPISHNIREGRLLVEASARNNTLVQHGTQCRSTPMMIEAMEQIRAGVIGEVLVAKCWNVQRRGSIGQGQDTDPPAGLDYDNWVGPATMLTYRTNRVHNRWTWWYHFGTGDMGNDGVHDIDYTRWGLGVDVHPNKVAAMGGKFVWEGDPEFPDTQQVTFEYRDPQGGRSKLLVYEQRLWSSNYPHNCDSGAEFYGTRGQLFLSRRGKFELLNESNRRQPLGIQPGGQDDVAHVGNFCEAIRGRGKTNADALTGHLSTSLCHLGNIATRLERSLEFDPASERFLNDDEANALVGREYREHWGRPQGA